jgi:hypothetical protein
LSRRQTARGGKRHCGGGTAAPNGPRRPTARGGKRRAAANGLRRQTARGGKRRAAHGGAAIAAYATAVR